MTAFARCVDFCERMYWHLQFAPDTNKFKLLAYKNASEALQGHGSLDSIKKVKGIGKAMLSYFDEIAKNKIPQVLKENSVFGPPFSVHELTRMQGIGPKTAQKLYEAQGIDSLVTLEKKIKSHEIIDAKLIAAFYDMNAVSERLPREFVAQRIEAITTAIQSVIGDAQLELVGSFRRHRPDIRDIDVLLGITDSATIKKVIAKAKEFADSVRLIDKAGDAKAEVQISIAGKQRKLDLYFIDPRYWGSALMHFTGPAKYNILIRDFAKSKKLKVSQYGVTDLKTKKIKRFATEQDFCSYLGIHYLAPELRDHVQSVKTITPEALTDLKSVFCDLHVHSTESDGLSTTNALVKYFLSSRLKYLGLSNHSPSTGSGMAVDRAEAYHERIRREIRRIKVTKPSGKVKTAKVLVGAEVDIKPDGDLDYDDKFLKTLDYVLVSVHHKQDFNVTQRLVKALTHIAGLGVPCILAHPTNRIIGYRSESTVAWSEVFKLCARHRIALEINGQGDRIDLPENLIHQAKSAGCIFAVSSDFHSRSPKTLPEYLGRAIMQARRGWLTKDKIINTDKELFKSWLGSRYKNIK